MTWVPTSPDSGVQEKLDTVGLAEDGSGKVASVGRPVTPNVTRSAGSTMSTSPANAGVSLSPMLLLLA